MKNKSQNIVIIVVVLIVLLILFLFAANSGKKRYDWEYFSLNYESDQPYGYLILQKTLQNTYQSAKFYTANTISKLYDAKEKTDYIAAGKYLNYKKSELDSLYVFVNKGNNLFFACDYLNDTVLMRFGIPKNKIFTRNIVSTAPQFNFFHLSLKKDKNIGIDVRENYKEKINYQWQYFDDNEDVIINTEESVITDYDEGYDEQIAEEAYIDEEMKIEPTDSIYNQDEEIEEPYDYQYQQTYDNENDYFGSAYLAGVNPANEADDIVYLDNAKKVICRRFGVGKGFVYILINPILLSNFYFTDSGMKALPIGILSHLDGENCVVDIEARYQKNDALQSEQKRTPLRYILSKKWFKRSFYGLLGLALFYVIIALFRKQRPMKIYKPAENKSVDLIKNIAAVLYHENNFQEAQTYYREAFEFWESNQFKNIDNMNADTKKAWERCQFLCRKDLWDANIVKEFQTLFNQLKSIYGN